MLIKFTSSKIKTLYFIFARFIGLCLKAGFLWYLSNRGFKEDSYLLSLYYISLASAMILFNNEAYFDFYKKKFDDNYTYFSVLRSKYIFVSYFINHFLFFFLFVFVYLYFIIGNIIVAISFFVLIVLEKIFDELLRFKLFSKRFVEWSNVFIVYTIFPVSIAFIFSLFCRTNIFLVYLLCLFLVIITSLLFYIPKIFKRIFLFIIKQLNFKVLKKYLFSYKERFFFNQFLAYLSSNILVFDKFILMSNSKESLASYYLISQFCNGINLLMDYFYVSTRRASYISKKFSVYQLLGEGRLIFIGFIGFILCNIFLFFYVTYLDNSFITFSHTFLISLFYLIFGLVSSFSQYTFWNTDKKIMILIELCFFGACIIIYYFLIQISNITFLYAILISFLFAHFFRSILYLILVNKINKLKK